MVPALHMDVLRRILALALALHPVVAPSTEPVHVTFGTRSSVLGGHNDADGGSLIAELSDGDLIVAGFGASYFTDVGESVFPMLARVDRASGLEWSRVYKGLVQHEAMAVVEHEGMILMLTRGPMPGTPLYGRPRRSAVTLARVRPDGELHQTNLLAGNMSVEDIVIRTSKGRPEFLVAGKRLPPAGDQNAYIEPARLFVMSVEGQVSEEPFPLGFIRIDELSLDRDEALLFLGERWNGQSGERWLVASSGPSVLWEVPLTKLAIKLRSMVVSHDHVYLVGRPAYRKTDTPLLAIRRGGDVAWCRGLPGFPRGALGASLSDGGLLLTGADDELARVTRLSANGEIQWSERFASAREIVRPAAAVELNDGAIAVTGATAPLRGTRSSSDADAFAVLSDATGSGFAHYASCAADRLEIGRLEERLRQAIGATIVRRSAMIAVEPRLPAADLGKPVPPVMDCGGQSEHDLLKFLADLDASVKALELTKPSERSAFRIIMRERGAIGGGGYQEGHRTSSFYGPSVEIEVGSERPGLDFVGGSVLPYLERSRVVRERFDGMMKLYFTPANRYEIGGGAAPFAVETLVAERLLNAVDATGPAQRKRLRAIYEGGAIAVTANRDVLHLWGDDTILIGSDRVEDAVPWLLRSLPELLETIEEEAAALEADVHLTMVKSNPDLPHDAFLQTLRTIATAATELSVKERNVLLNTRATVTVSMWAREGVHLRGHRREVTTRPEAAPDVLPFILDRSEVLRRQELPD